MGGSKMKRRRQGIPWYSRTLIFIAAFLMLFVSLNPAAMAA